MNPFIVVFGNSKGGTGKSTLAVHFAVRMMDLGFNVSVVDCDTNQGTMCRYFVNRSKELLHNENIKMPHYSILTSSKIDGHDLSLFDQLKRELRLTGNHEIDLENFIQNSSSYDFIVIDTPGNINELMLLSHSYADVVITPINNSLVDLDMIGDIEENDRVRFGLYTDVFWEAKKKKATRAREHIEWIVVKNRLNSNPKSSVVDDILKKLSVKCGFKIAPGLCERSIFRDLFRSGLTVFDDSASLSLSHIVARSEIDGIVNVVFDSINRMRFTNKK
ncbi:division plane positioning ATPase MipZ [Candidatus Gromoviella agglomerans]|uniref:division plane positioning ATPase MipZ n=1 Tax=Candidatus Gromoviella agglomerans TaxID=2806609 RepID=UPI001E2D837D|nr:division plane positioning ATPase MipZ [Candidatus Gromoviella agglomerans]UFX98466.1 ParA family protein [Candidatus Gromoviella agglomerans]